MSTPGPADSPPPAEGPSRPGVWVAVGILLIGLVAWASTVLVAVYKDKMSEREEPEPIPLELRLLQVRVEIPLTVTAGQPFELRVSMRNPGNQDLELESIDLEEDLHDAFSLRKIPEGWVETIPGDPVEYFFNEPVSPGKVVEKVFELQALEPGVYLGMMDVWNSDEVVSMPISLEVTPGVPAADPAAPAEAPGATP
ncbi:MAG: hypothetical protein HKN82_17380 [Akkermansiaceae bacterium]|nr:hypothetical protein [Akkermansiaceae bacterium]NNM31018.1 hypothetical protein [Akkermansiaceae bacterium]